MRWNNMVRRRGAYEINVLGKQLVCLFCQGTTFTHREVYIKIVNHHEGERKKKLTLQSFTCGKCGQEQKFQEHKMNATSNIKYIQVSDK